MNNLPEPTRNVPSKAGSAGTLQATTLLTPKACTTRARISVPPNRVLPIIFVPGIMGSNLKATVGNKELKPGAVAWRPPNGLADGKKEVDLWRGRDSNTRQKILNGPTVTVDRDGETILNALHAEIGLSSEEARECGWGEVHSDSYQAILYALRRQFSSFVRPLLNGSDTLTSQWDQLNLFTRNAGWRETSGPLSELTDCEVRKLADCHYPTYAVGYNWLNSNAISAESLAKRIEEIIKKWKDAGRSCEKVIVVTHSMGGLVARACAKKIPEKIAGIVHGCMPALGAPACYRRMACGAEQSSPSRGSVDNFKMKQIAIILGNSPSTTVPVIGNSVGALELLPTHRYPSPWLFASIKSKSGVREVIPLQMANPYDLYANTSTWYRLIDPSLMDPASLNQQPPAEKFEKNIRLAEDFHRNQLDNFFHPITYAFFGADPAYLAYGTFTWLASPESPNISPGDLQNGTCVAGDEKGREVALPSKTKILFVPSAQDAEGDGTVPVQSGSAPLGLAQRTLRSSGFDHQGGYNDTSMIYLTLLLVSRIALQNA